MTCILDGPATEEQVAEMLAELGTYIKLAVDIRLGVVAGGGLLHADCEAASLDEGSRQEDIWGADWVPSRREIGYGSFVNIRPQQGNRSMQIVDPGIRDAAASVIRSIFGGP